MNSFPTQHHVVMAASRASMRGNGVCGAIMLTNRCRIAPPPRMRVILASVNGGQSTAGHQFVHKMVDSGGRNQAQNQGGYMSALRAATGLPGRGMVADRMLHSTINSWVNAWTISLVICCCSWLAFRRCQVMGSVSWESESLGACIVQHIGMANKAGHRLRHGGWMEQKESFFIGGKKWMQKKRKRTRLQNKGKEVS